MDREEAKLLVGATIIATGAETIYSVTYPTVTVRTREGRFLKVFVQSDEEGNRGGFLAMDEIEREHAESKELAQ